MTTYVRKPSPVTAIKFAYSDEGIKELKELCGDELRNYGKNAGLFEKGWAWIGSNRLVAVAGDYIVKENNEIKIYKEEEFFKLFEETK